MTFECILVKLFSFEITTGIYCWRIYLLRNSRLVWRLGNTLSRQTPRCINSWSGRNDLYMFTIQTILEFVSLFLQMDIFMLYYGLVCLFLASDLNCPKLYLMDCVILSLVSVKQIVHSTGNSDYNSRLTLLSGGIITTEVLHDAYSYVIIRQLYLSNPQ